MYESQYKCISARHARRAVPATRRPRVTECHRTVTKPSRNVTDCSKMSQRRRAARAGRRMLATPRPPRGARRPPPSRHRMSQNHHRMSHIATNCHRAAVPRAPGGACSPRNARRAAPAARRPRVVPRAPDSASRHGGEWQGSAASSLYTCCYVLFFTTIVQRSTPRCCGAGTLAAASICRVGNLTH